MTFCYYFEQAAFLNIFMIKRLSYTKPLMIRKLKVMPALPNCPKCHSEYTYEDNSLFICPECAHEWNKNPIEEFSDNNTRIIKDAHGNELQDGDTVTVIKDLKIKGSSLTVKVGTKVRNIRLIDGDHDIDCKIDGIGATQLKSQFVKKV